LLIAAALTTGGCGKGNAPAADQPKAAAPVKKAAAPANALSPNLVSAVSAAKGGSPLFDVKFEVGSRPDLGAPIDVDLVLVPLADTVDGFSGTVQGDDGLDVVEGGSIAPADKVVVGTPIHHAVRAVARHDGIFTLTVNLAVVSAGQPVSVAYSMPIIAGRGFTEAGATPAAPAGQAKQKPKPPAAAQ
jgi:hypothetical protein